MGILTYLKRVAVAEDQFDNALLGGYPDETISSRAGRNRDKWYWKPLYKALDTLLPNHCENAVKDERDRKHEPPELRK